MNLKEYFTYHPVKTPQREAAHDEINAVSLELAQTINRYVKDDDCKKMALFAVQQARMFANQGATIDELRRIEEETKPAPESPL